MSKTTSLSFSIVVGFVFCAARAGAADIGLPHVETCTDNGTYCLSIFNNGVGGGIRAGGGNAFVGVEGDSDLSNGTGVEGLSHGDSTTMAVHGINFQGVGVRGDSDSYIGVYGLSTQDAGVQGESTNSYGIYGRTSAGGTRAAVFGDNVGHGYGILGRVKPAGTGVAIFGENNSSAGYAGYFHGNVLATGTITANSDIRLKKNVHPIDDALKQALALRGVTFEWKEPEEHTGAGVQWGFIAQEVEKVHPGWVGTDDKGFKTLDTRQMVPILVESVRALKSENDSLRDRVDALEGRRRFTLAGFAGDGLLNGVGLALVAGAVVFSRRRRSGS